MSRYEPEFCPECDVSSDLHDGPNTCDVAESKARLLEAFCRTAGIR